MNFTKRHNFKCTKMYLNESIVLIQRMGLLAETIFYRNEV